MSQKKRWWLRLHEKKGKLNEMPCHQKLEAYLAAYFNSAGIARQREGQLFCSAIGKTAQFSARLMRRGYVCRMARRRASDVGSEIAIGCRTFRRTGSTDYLTKYAQPMAGHSNAKTTGLYDRVDNIDCGEVERIVT